MNFYSKRVIVKESKSFRLNRLPKSYNSTNFVINTISLFWERSQNQSASHYILLHIIDSSTPAERTRLRRSMVADKSSSKSYLRRCPSAVLTVECISQFYVNLVSHPQSIGCVSYVHTGCTRSMYLWWNRRGVV